jgi:hypothetical protein
MVNTNFIPRTYTPKRKVNYHKRDNYESLLKKLYEESNKTKYNGDLSYLSDNELLVSINGLLSKLGLTTMDENELSRPLSLRN